MNLPLPELQCIRFIETVLQGLGMTRPGKYRVLQTSSTYQL